MAKRSCLNMKLKMEIIQRIEDGDNIRRIASDYNASVPLIYKIKTSKEDVKNYCNKLKTRDGKESTTKTMKSAWYYSLVFNKCLVL